MAEATAVKPDAILVPKVSSPGHMERIAEALADLAADRRIQVWAMMETPLAVLNAGVIAAATDGRTRLSAFVMGTRRSCQGYARADCARPPGLAVLADDLRGGGARLWPRHSRWRLQRHRRH
jgi:citrate lyase beta subunit